VIVFSAITLASCEDESLPGVGGIEDNTPPTAGFISQNSEFSDLDTDLIVFRFINASESATNYKWKLPEGASIFVEQPPVVESDDSAEVKAEKESKIEQLAKEAKELIEFNNTELNVGFDISDLIFTEQEALEISEIEDSGVAEQKRNEIFEKVRSTTWDVFQKNILVKFDDYKDYEIELLSIDGNGKANRVIETLNIVKAKPTPIIKNPDFNDEGNPRLNWENKDLGPSGGNSGDSNDGGRSLKFDANDQRIAFQDLKVTPDTEYVFSFFYSIKDVGDSELEVRILSLADGDITKSNIESRTLSTAIFDVDEATKGSKNFNEGSLGFKSGIDTNVGIYFKAIGGGNGTDGTAKNGGQDVRIDTASIKVIE